MRAAPPGSVISADAFARNVGRLANHCAAGTGGVSLTGSGYADAAGAT